MSDTSNPSPEPAEQDSEMPVEASELSVVDEVSEDPAAEDLPASPDSAEKKTSERSDRAKVGLVLAFIAATAFLVWSVWLLVSALQQPNDYELQPREWAPGSVTYVDETSQELPN